MKKIIAAACLTIAVISTSHAQASASDLYLPPMRENSPPIVVDRDTYGTQLVNRIITPAYYAKFVDLACGTLQYDCNGIMLSAFEEDSPYWMSPTPTAGKFSMTYFQRDTTWAKGIAIYGTGGFMLWPQALLRSYGGTKGNLFNPIYRCIFPGDGGTDDRSDNGCGELRGDADSAPCQSLGILNAKSWIQEYGTSYETICGFTLGKSPRGDSNIFVAVREIQQTLAEQYLISRGKPFPAWDEVILKPWDSYAPSRIPLLAFFHISDPSLLTAIGGDLQSVQHQQTAYYEATRIFVPIIQISGSAWDNIHFNYIADQQAPGIPNAVQTLVSIDTTGRPLPNLSILRRGSTITFVNASSDIGAAITSYAWDFGDGSTSSDISPSHIYQEPGAYVVSLTATDNSGAANTARFGLTIPAIVH